MDSFRLTFTANSKPQELVLRLLQIINDVKFITYTEQLVDVQLLFCSMTFM